MRGCARLVIAHMMKLEKNFKEYVTIVEEVKASSS